MTMDRGDLSDDEAESLKKEVQKRIRNRNYCIGFSVTESGKTDADDESGINIQRS